MALGLTRGLNEKSYSDAPDSFCAGCLAGADRVAAARRAAFLRRKYATRRLRFTRTRCCCPINLYRLKIAQTQCGIENRSRFFNDVSRRRSFLGKNNLAVSSQSVPAQPKLQGDPPVSL